MGKAGRDEEREERIIMDIVVDAYGPEEQVVMGWHYYLQDTLQFSFTATCISKSRAVISVVCPASNSECQGNL